jgi:hypothetical protein
MCVRGWTLPGDFTKVYPDHHVQVQKALYSVPTGFIGKTMAIRADRLTVRMYLGLELIKTHARKAQGQRSTDVNDFLPGKAPLALRDVDAVIRTANSYGDQIGRFALRLVDSPLSWLRLRQACKLLRLCDGYRNDKVSAQCAWALALDVIDVRKIEGMLKDARRAEDEAVAKRQVIPVPARFARDISTFSKRQVTSSEHGNEEMP